MKLKVKNFNWSAGRPVVFLNEETAKKLHVHVDEKVEIRNSKSINAIVDIFPKMVKNNEIGLSKEVTDFIKAKNKSYISVSLADFTKTTMLIKKKLSGKELSKEELNTIVSEIVQNNLTEAEIAYFIAATKMRGMSLKETINMTKVMVENGKILKFNKKIIADKHCIGGLAGNRTTPILVSICASAGLYLPKTSSRAITSASGTADVIETIADIEFSLVDLKKIVNKTGACLSWSGSLGISPSDDKIIEVQRLLNLNIESQMIPSIMSKKIAAGATHLLIDIPYGTYAKIKTKKKAKELSNHFYRVAKNFKIKLKTILTDGSQPIGNGIGPVLEMLDILEVLQGRGPEDLKEKSLLLSAELMSLCGIKNSKKIARDILSSGKAFEKFKQIINMQNNSNDFEKRVKLLKVGEFSRLIRVKRNGKIVQINNRQINRLCRILGTPESKSSGVYLHRHLGPVKKSEKLITLYSESPEKLRSGLKFLSLNKIFIIK